MMYKKISSAGLIGLTLILGLSCVTVNVNFPEGAVQKATDDYVRELYRSKTKTTSFRFLDWFIPSAHADVDAEFKIKTDKTMEVFDKMKPRVPKIVELKSKGWIGENNKGFLVLKTPHDPKEKEKKGMEAIAKKLIEEDNRDRTILYEEVLDANQLPKNKLPNIQSSFSRSFVAESPSKTWVQTPTGDWELKQ